MILFGASGHGKVVHSAIRNEVIGFFDDDHTIREFLGLRVHAYQEDKYIDEKVIISIGNNNLRKVISEKIVHTCGLVIAQSAHLDVSVQPGLGSQILHMSLVQAGTKIGKHVIINSAASVDHDCIIENYVHIAPHATLCGNVIVGTGTLIGAGAVVLPGISIGKWCTIGAGSVVTRNVKDYTTVFGNPAKTIKTDGKR